MFKLSISKLLGLFIVNIIFAVPLGAQESGSSAIDQADDNIVADQVRVDEPASNAQFPVAVPDRLLIAQAPTSPAVPSGVKPIMSTSKEQPVATPAVQPSPAQAPTMPAVAKPAAQPAPAVTQPQPITPVTQPPAPAAIVPTIPATPKISTAGTAPVTTPAPAPVATHPATPGAPGPAAVPTPKTAMPKVPQLIHQPKMPPLIGPKKFAAAPALEKAKEAEEIPLAPQVPTPEGASAAPSVAPKEFDTSKIKQYTGNWVIKRGWWENAEAEYDKIRKLTGQLEAVKMMFFEKRNELQRSLFEPFYRNIGFEQGELKDTLVYLIDQVESAREAEGTLDIKQREFLTLLEEEKKTLEQLKLDMDQFSKFGDAINNAVDLLMKELNQARQYDQTAWQEFKAIADDLSDIKARERYYTIRTLYKNIKNIDEYVRGDFQRYFNNLQDDAHKEADRIKMAVQALKSKGIDLKNEAKKLAEEPSKAAPAPTCGIPAEQPGYFMSAVYWVGGALKSTWNLIFGWIYRF